MKLLSPWIVCTGRPHSMFLGLLPYYFSSINGIGTTIDKPLRMSQICLADSCTFYLFAG